MLKKNLSTFSLIAASIAGMVGSGWLFGPFFAAKLVGPASVLSWLIAGFLMLFIAVPFCILGQIMPITGGTVRFLQLTYGHFAGLTFSWIVWLGWISITPIEALAILQYAANYFPELMKTVEGGAVLSFYGFCVALVIMFVTYLINLQSVKVFSMANYLTLGVKIGIPILTLILLFSYSFHAENFHQYGGFVATNVSSIFSALPLAGIAYSIMGFNPAIQMAQEVKKPHIAIPVAIISSIIFVTILYALLQVAFIGALDANMLRNGWTQLEFSGDNGPFAGLLMNLGLLWFVKLLYIDAIISPYGTALVQAASTGRLTYAMAENRYFPKFLKKINKNHVPARALLLNALMGIVFFLPFPSWQKLVGFLVSTLTFGYVAGPLSLMAIHLKHKKDKNHITHSKWIEYLCLFSFYVCNLFIFWAGWDILYKVGISFIIGYIVLFCYAFWGTTRTSEYLSFDRGWWTLVYVPGILLISWLGSFGSGKNIIPFGWDFVILAIFSALIYYIARFQLKLSSSFQTIKSFSQDT